MHAKTRSDGNSSCTQEGRMMWIKEGGVMAELKGIVVIKCRSWVCDMLSDVSMSSADANKRMASRTAFEAF